MYTKVRGLAQLMYAMVYCADGKLYLLTGLCGKRGKCT